MTGLPSTEHPRVNDGSAGWQFSTDIRSHFFIDGNYLYLLNTQRGQLRVYNKITGLPSTEHPRVNDGSSGGNFIQIMKANFLLMEVIYIF